MKGWGINDFRKLGQGGAGEGQGGAALEMIVFLLDILENNNS